MDLVKGAWFDLYEIIFYYNANTMSYTVQYLEQGTNKVLYNELVKRDVKFGSKITETALDIPGYTAAVKEKTVDKLNYTTMLLNSTTLKIS